MNKIVLKSKQELLNLLGIKDNYLYSEFTKKYYFDNELKKDGSYRKIAKPSLKLKNMQRRILDEILKDIKRLPCVFGLEGQKGILQNALFHQKNSDNDLVNLDIQDFYPNIKYKDVQKIFTRIGFSNENSKILTKICTIDRCLPQGSPTSQHLASLFMKDLDKKIFAYCQKNKIIYSRYFDDITFSGKNIKKSNIKYVENLIIKKGLKLKDSKKKEYYGDTDKVVNGINLNLNSVDITKEYKDEIINSYADFKKLKNMKNWRSFMGKFGFYLHINKDKAKLFFKENTGFDYKNKKLINCGD